MWEFPHVATDVVDWGVLAIATASFFPYRHNKVIVFTQNSLNFPNGGPGCFVFSVTSFVTG